DEAYYYRQLAEYDRDAAEERARKALEAKDLANGRATADKLLADPPPLAPGKDETDAMRHLREEMGRNGKRAEQIGHGLGSLPSQVRDVWTEARDAELKVVEQVKREVEHQKKVDVAVATMDRLDGPTDPAANEKDTAAQAKLRAEACNGAARQTRHCL